MSENQNTEKKKNNTPKQKKKLPRWMIILIASVCGLILVVGGFFAYANTYRNIYPNVEVAGIKLGGLDCQEAQVRLDEGFKNIDTNRAVTFVCGENSKEVLLSEIVVGIDSLKTAETAFASGRSGGFFGKGCAMISSWFKKTQAPIFAKVDTELLETLIGELAGESEIPMTETTYEIQGNSLTLIKGNPGMMVSREKVLAMIGDALINPGISRIDMAVEWTEPKVIELDALYTELTQPITNAYYSMVDGRVVVIPEKGGVTVDKNLLKSALESDEERCTVAISSQPYQATAKDLEDMLFRDVIGAYSSDFSTSSQSRATNVELTASRIDGYILMPGDVFSYDKTVGSRTIENGYKVAGIYVGNRTESGVGGGICQTSSTLYSAVLYANLEIVQRTSHSLPISYVPAGMDATIAEGYIDFQFKNNTPYPIQIRATAENRKLTCELLGVKEPGMEVEISNYTTAVHEPGIEKVENAEIPAGYKRVISRGNRGYSVASKRIVKVDGRVVKEEKLTSSTYRATNTQVEVNPADKETPIDALAVYVAEEHNQDGQNPETEGETPENIENSESTENTESGENSESTENPESGENTEIQDEPADVPVDEEPETVEVVDEEPQTENIEE